MQFHMLKKVEESIGMLRREQNQTSRDEKQNA